jgi:hypothetical protein
MSCLFSCQEMLRAETAGQALAPRRECLTEPARQARHPGPARRRQQQARDARQVRH